MMALILVVTAVLAAAVLDIVALAWGTDSRDPLPDDHRR